MYQRILNNQNYSIFLFGPRGTGKTTWLKQRFQQATFYDFLDTKEVLRFSKEPSLLYRETSRLPKESWVILDEVQKVPELLNEVHRLMENQGLKFVLSGSSSRKLKREGTNLLAGRARVAHLFPLVSAEVEYQIDLARVLQFGMLPMAFTSDDPSGYLTSYAEVYLREEIRGEALTRNIGGFGRFLEVAARQNGQVTNVTNIGRDASVARQTVEGYFDILIDTLIGFWLQPWKLKRATKQVAHPKFYFFDAGVVRALSGRMPYPPSPEEQGPLLETFLLGEMNAWCSYSRLDYPLHFWSRHGGVEVDLFLETKDGYVAIEIKSANRWDPSFNRGLKGIKQELGSKVRCLGVYLGEREARFDDIRVLPALSFLKELWGGELIR